MLYGFSELSGTPLYPKYLQFRHRVFNERLGYHQPGGPVSAFAAFPDLKPLASWASGVEFDGCDVPATIHLAYVSPMAGALADPAAFMPDFGGKITGCIRMLPTDGHYMIRDAIEQGLWKNVPLLADLPASADIYESSRVAISPDFAQNDPARHLILDNLVYGLVELAFRLGIKRIIGIMYREVFRSVFEKRGVPIRYLSERFKVDDGPPILIGDFDVAIGMANLNRHFAAELCSGLIVPAQVDAQTLLAHQCHVQSAKNQVASG